jgi:hypothetical protein
MAALLIACGSSSAAQRIDSTYPYFDDIVHGLGIDPDEPDVWDIGNAEYAKGQQIVGMYAYYRKTPRTYNHTLCVLESRSRIAEIDSGKFSWSDESLDYQVWLSSTLGCDVQHPDDIPQHSLVSGDITLEEAHIVLLNEPYLFQEAVGRSGSGQYSDWGTYYLSGISKTDRLVDAEGQVFIAASFASPGKYEGPTVYLQIENGQVRIDRVGHWIS